MKHAGSRDDLLTRTPTEQTEPQPPAGAPRHGAPQSRLSLVVSLACALFLVAVVLDPVVRDHARTLDPTVVHALRLATEFGNSAWPLGIGLALLACVAVARRRTPDDPSGHLMRLRSTLWFMIASVAISGILANLAKNIIGRARPSAMPDIGVLEFSPLALMPSWASFPSGHATTATACAVALALSCPRHAWAWLAVGGIAALSRPFLAVHWMSDAVAGIALGTVVTLAIRTAMLARGHQFGVEPSALSQSLVAALAELGGLAGRGLGLGLSALRAVRRKVFPDRTED
ncbi:MAG: phosphatase PAP2 family protein [Tabrizicola sp.]